MAAEAFSEFPKFHQNVRSFNCSLFLDTETPFIGPTSDRIVSFDCCGKACLEKNVQKRIQMFILD